MFLANQKDDFEVLPINATGAPGPPGKASFDMTFQILDVHLNLPLT